MRKLLTLLLVLVASTASAQLTSNARTTFENKMFTEDGYFRFPSYAADPAVCNATNHEGMVYWNTATNLPMQCSGASWEVVAYQATSVTSAMIVDSTIVTADILNGTILAADLAANTLTATEIGPGAVLASELGVTAGATTASRALVVDGAGAMDVLTVTSLTAPTLVSATTLTTASVRTTQGNGAVGGAWVTAVEKGNEVVHQSVFTLNVAGANLVTLADSADHGGSKLLYTFPAGAIYVMGAVLDGVVTNTAAFNASDNDHYNVSIGSAAAGDDGDLTGTEVSFIAKTDVDTAAGVTTTQSKKAITTTAFALDGTTAAATMYFNVSVLDTQTTGSNDFGLTGTLTVTWANLGDK
jgi:hypothetical protein